MKSISKYLAFLLGLCLVLSSAVSSFAESYTGDVLRLLRFDGDVAISDAQGNDRFVMENVRFSSGETLKTGTSSAASVSLDTDRIVSGLEAHQSGRGKIGQVVDDFHHRIGLVQKALSVFYFAFLTEDHQGLSRKLLRLKQLFVNEPVAVCLLQSEHLSHLRDGHVFSVFHNLFL